MPRAKAKILPQPSEWEESRRISNKDSKELTARAAMSSSVAASRQALALLLSDPALRRENLGELLARRYAKEALEGMMEIARDQSVEAGVRHRAYYDVFTLGYGKPASVVRNPGETALPPTIDADIDRAGEAAAALSQMEAYAAVPPEEWPEELRRATGMLRSKEDGDR
jgi:hypothetical protein